MKPIHGMVILCAFLLGIILSATSAPSKQRIVLENIRAGRHPQYASIVFHLSHSVHHAQPRIIDNTLSFKLDDVSTSLKPYRKYRTFDSYIALRHSGEDLEVVIGLPDRFKRFSAFTMQAPHRLVINLYIEPAEENSPPAAGPIAIKDKAPPAGTPSRLQESVPKTSGVAGWLDSIRTGRHKDYASVVFEFSDSVEYSQPEIRDGEIVLTLFRVITILELYRKFRNVDSWVELIPTPEKIDIRIGIPNQFARMSAFRMEAPHRLVINMYIAEPTPKIDAPAIPIKQPDLPPGPVPPPSVPEPRPEAAPLPSAPDRRQMARIEARILSKKEFHEKALQIYHRLREQDPEDEEIWEEYIETLIDAARYEPAQAEVQKLLRKNPNNVRAQRMQARIYMELRQSTWTYPVFDRLLNVNKWDAGIWSDYAFARLDAQEWAPALNYFSQALELDPENNEALRGVHAILKEHRPRLDAAFRRYTQEAGDATTLSASTRYVRHLTDRTTMDFTYDWTSVDRPASSFFAGIDERINEGVLRLRHQFNRYWQGRFGIGGYTGLGDGTTFLLGADYSPWNNFLLRADYAGGRPWYDPMDAALLDGSYDQLALALDWSIRPSWALFLGAEQWNYFVDEDSDYGTKRTFTGILTKRLFESPAFSVSYSYYSSDFDYEDDTFTPIAMVPSESVHGISANFEHAPCTYWSFGISGGRRWDVARSLSSWYVLPIVKLRLGNRMESAISFEFNSESGAVDGGETQTLRFWNRILF